jgi:hypothetical protein
MEREAIDHWLSVCRTQFPIYLEHWAKYPSHAKRTPLLQEQVFDVPYRLPSGRTVRLRGKWDAVELVGTGKDAGIWLGEHKTKGDIDEEQLQRQLTFDLQVGVYLTALHEVRQQIGTPLSKRVVDLTKPIRGVHYNVVRRPLSGGKGSIVRHKATASKPEETREHYYGRLGDIIREDSGHYFMRWDVAVTPFDVERFRQRCLDPILEQLCDWWQWVSAPLLRDDPFMSPRGEDFRIQAIHWQHPFGCVNHLDDGGSSDLDAHLETGSEAGLCRVDKLFEELT